MSVSLVVFSWAYFLYSAFDLSFAFFIILLLNSMSPYIHFFSLLSSQLGCSAMTERGALDKPT